MGAIGDVFMRVLFEDQQLTAEGKRAGAKAGDAAGKSMSQRIKSSLGPAIATGIGTVLGAGFAIAAKGAAELDAATRQFQADTGATAEEATKASHAIAGMYRDNLQGFDQISAALSKVHTDLGLTGKAAEDATERFLKFSTATGQDAGAAVASFDDILDAWNLTAADAGPLMDKLIAGRNRFGGVLSENQNALSKMAPAMTAANMTVDDGIALLNLFNTAGIDASKAPAALAKAVAQLKPGQDLNDLIAQIGAIEDPTLRAQAAMKIFGARGGTQFAQAFKPGITSLRDYNTTAEETVGATDRAADAIESSFGNQFKLILKNAGGALAEFGNNFGPLLLVAGQFGPKMITAIGGGLGAIAGKLFPGLIARLIPAAAIAGTTTGAAMGTSAAIAEVATQTTGVVAGQAAVGTAAIPAATTAGSVIGRAMGLAASAALVMAIPLAIAAATALIGDQVLEGIKTDLEKKTTDAIAAGSLEGLKAHQLELTQRLRIARAGHLSGPMLESLERQIAEVERALAFGPPTPRGVVGPEQFGPPNPQLAQIDSTLTATQKQLHADLETAITTIKTSNDPAAVGAAIAAVVQSVLGGAGGAAGTRALVTELTAKRDAALARGDTATAKLFADAIARIEPFAKGRQWQAEQIAEARKVVASNATTAEKVAALKQIQADLLSHQRTMAADIVAGLIRVETAVEGIPVVNAATGFTTGHEPAPKSPATPPAKPAVPKVNPATGFVTRATGGPVAARQSYWVGEQGPELFTPRNPGEIIANNVLRALQGLAEAQFREKADQAFRNRMRNALARFASPGGALPPKKLAALARFLKAGGVGQFEKGGDFYNAALGVFQDPRFVASAKLDASQIRDLRTRAAGGPLGAHQMALVGERGPELFVPRVSGTNMPMADVPQGGVRGGDTYNVPITGLIKARDPFEIATQIKRVRDFVVVTPRTEPA